MEHITLCGKQVPVYPAKTWRIKKHILGPLFALAQNGQGTSIFSGLSINTVDEEVYKLLVLLAPKVEKYVPLHEFLGYRTADGMAADDHPEDDDLGTDIPEIEEALKVAIHVSRIDVVSEVKHLKQLVDPEWARTVITEGMQEVLDTVRAQVLMSSGNLPFTKGGSDPSTNGKTTPPTSTASTESPSPVLSV